MVQLAVKMGVSNGNDSFQQALEGVKQFLEPLNRFGEGVKAMAQANSIATLIYGSFLLGLKVGSMPLSFAHLITNASDSSKQVRRVL